MMHINDYYYHMFPGARGLIDPPVGHGDKGPGGDYADWTLDCECGIVSTEICIAASRFLDQLDPCVDRMGIYRAVYDQIRVICYG